MAGNVSSRTRRGLIPSQNKGPFEALVINHLDPTYMGVLEVELLKNTGSGNNPERTGQVFTVRYLSPFYGSTPEIHTSANDGYEYTQKSYGFWMIPPDINTKVLVIFAEDNSAYGYWIGCIQDQFMNFQIPGYGASTYYHTDSTPNGLKPYKLPVGEYNKKVETGEGRDPTKFKKPYNKDFTQVLENQGLLKDEIRGTTTTSARRDLPSMVFGFSTPGPLDKRPGAPQYQYGNQRSKANQFYNRLGGSSLVFDDGDDKYIRRSHAEDGPPDYANVEAGDIRGDQTIPHNEHVRLRTRTGHQILLHNSEDLIYIGNSRGTAWIELTSDGKIDIHADDSISIMTGADLNITAERDINMEAGRNINMKATSRYSGGAPADINGNESGRIQQESAYNTNIDVGFDYKLTVHNMSDTVVFKDMKTLVKQNWHLHTLENIYDYADQNVHIEADQSMFLEADTTVNILARGLITGDAEEIHWNSKLTRPATEAEDAVEVVHLPTINLPYIKPGDENPTFYESILCRAPQHEPWPSHENLNPLAYKTRETDRESPGALTLENFKPYTPDTFAKGSGQGSQTPPGSASSGGAGSPSSPSGSSAAGGSSGSQPAGSSPSNDPLNPTRPNSQPSNNGQPQGAQINTGDTSGDIVQYIASKEGFHSTPYWDYAQWTIGYGTRASGQNEGPINEQEGLNRLRSTVSGFRQSVIQYGNDNGYNWTPKQVDALTSFTFNLGTGALAQVTENGTRDNATIAEKMKLYNKAGGQTLQGLVVRRNEESAMFAAGTQTLV